MFGVPSLLAVCGVIFAQSLVQIVINSLPGVRGELIWPPSLAAAALWLYSRWERSYQQHLAARAEAVQSEPSSLTSRRALVTVIGLDSAAPSSPLARLLAEMPGLEFVALIGTYQTRVMKVADTVAAQLLPAAGLHLPAERVFISEQNTAESMADLEASTGAALGWLFRQGVSPGEVIVDVSAGKRAMGFGALVAAGVAGVDAQYLTADWDHLAGQPIAGSLGWKLIRQAASQANA